MRSKRNVTIAMSSREAASAIAALSEFQTLLEENSGVPEDMDDWEIFKNEDPLTRHQVEDLRNRLIAALEKAKPKRKVT